MLFSEALEGYKAYLVTTDKRPATLEGYRHDLTCFIRWLESEYNCPAFIGDITVRDIEKYLQFLRDERDYQPASRKRSSISIKMFLKYCYKKKLTKEDLASEIESIKVPLKERDHLSEKEVMDFVKAMDHDLVKVIALTMYYTGLRISEIINLTVEDVDLERNVLKVVNGKGRKNRTIPISSKLRDLLLDYVAWRVPSQHFFATKKTGRVSKMTVDRAIRQTRQKLNLKKNVTAHTFRHSFASQLVAKNVNIVHISKLLGHSDIKVTSVYTHTDTSQLEDAVNEL